MALLCLSINAISTSVYGEVFYVDENGSDSATGLRAGAALRTIQKALDLAYPGDRIRVAAGDYWEDIRSVRSGRESAPIHIMGESGARVRGKKNSRMVEIQHSYIVIENLILDGKAGSGKRARDYRDKLIYVLGRRGQGVRGIRIINASLRNAGGECLRLKYFAQYNEVSGSSFYNCGVWDFKFKQGGKNGEAIYIGTAPEQLERNPTHDVDASDHNWIHHNQFDTQGNECVDIKEGASHNIVEHNECTGQRDPNSGGLSVRGNHNILRFNVVKNNVGAGIRLGGDTAKDGIHNQIYGNQLIENQYGGLKILARPQDKVCANRIEPDDKRAVRGKFGKGIKASQACSH